MIKVNSAARALIGIACLAAAGTSVAGCSTTAQASDNTSGSNTSVTTASASPSTAPASTSTPSTGSNQSPATPSKPQGNSPARCHTSDLSASFTVVYGSAGAGSISYNLRVTNTSMHQCTIYGFAGMLLLDASHTPLPTNVAWDSLVPRRLLRLNPGGSAAATARFSPDVPGAGDNPGPACQPTAFYTEVTPPDETTQLVTAVTSPTPVCERGSIQLSAFVAGPTGPNQP